MCWSPKIKTPAVTAQVAAPTPNEPIPVPKGVEFGDEGANNNDSASSSSKGVKSLTIAREDKPQGVSSVNYGFAASTVNKRITGSAKK